MGGIIQDWLATGVVTKISPELAASCSPIFTVPERDSEELRLITNLKNVHAFF